MHKETKALRAVKIINKKRLAEEEKQKLLNPVWHVHHGKPPKEKSIMPFSVLLNLVDTSNASDKDILWKFIKKNKKDIKISDHPILDSLIGYALKYYYHYPIIL